MDEVNEQHRLTGREIVYGIVGVLLGLLLVSGVWLMAGPDTPRLPTLTEVSPRDAPSFQLTTLAGEPVTLDAYRGQVILLNFWGTYCEPCKAETPALQAAYDQFKDAGLIIIGVDLYPMERAWGRTEQHIREFATLYGVSYPIVLDVDGQVSQAYSITQTPTSYVIDPKGKLRYVKVGTLTELDIARVVQSLQAGGRTPSS